ncbi:MAG: metallophosphoesterase [Candidatus Eisenbacteria bacterium]|nr:metallophosphoesterase [Candidatus Eisenbacteria bacterium]
MPRIRIAAEAFRRASSRSSAGISSRLVSRYGDLRPLALALALLACPWATAALAHAPIQDHLRALDLAIRREPSRAELYLQRAQLRRSNHEWAAAGADLDRAARLGPDLPGLPLEGASLLLDSGHPAQARIVLNALLAGAPHDLPARVLRARVRSAAGDHAGAAEDLEFAVASAAAPDPDWYLRLADERAAGPGGAAAALAALEAGISRLGPAPALEGAAASLEARLGRRGAALRRQSDATARWDSGNDAGAAPAPGATPVGVVAPRGGVAPASAPVREFRLEPASGAVPDARLAPVAALVTRGPYLQLATPAGITVRWRTDVATDSRVTWGPSPASQPGSLSDAALTTEHELALTGLSPDTRYYYSVGTSAGPLAGGDTTCTFVTHPVAGTPRRTRAWILGDSGLGNAGARAVRDAFRNHPGSFATDLWLMLGDNAYSSGTDAQYQAGVFDMYPDMLRRAVLWPTRGNHDVLYAGPNNDYYDVFTMPAAAQAGGVPSGTEAYYSFDHGQVHFICLDSEGSSRAVGGAMLQWLRSDLASTPRPWVIAFWHHPPYTKGSHDSDNDLDSGGRMRDMRQNVLPILDSLGVDLVLTGHSHSYERSFLLKSHYGKSNTLTSAMKVDSGDGREAGTGAYHKPTLGNAPGEGSVYAVAGSSCQASGGTLDHPVMVVSLNVMGSMLLDFDGARLDARFLDDLGVVRDSFTVLKGTAIGIPGAAAARAALRLSAVSPNPSRGASHVSYELPASGRARITVFDAAGRRVTTLVDEAQAAGPHQARWDGRDARGRRAPAGAYWCALEFRGERRARALIRVE